MSSNERKVKRRKPLVSSRVLQMKNAKKDSKKTKKSKEKKQKAKPLEEIREIKKTEKEIAQDFFEEPIRQIPIFAETRAPVLERIIQRQMPIENPIEIEQPKETREERRIDYSPTTNSNYGFQRNATEDKEKKYETNFVPPVLSRREMPSNAMRQDFLKSPGENWSNRINESQLNEIEFVEQETKLPFEEQQKKYKRFKIR